MEWSLHGPRAPAKGSARAVQSTHGEEVWLRVQNLFHFGPIGPVSRSARDLRFVELSSDSRFLFPIRRSLAGIACPSRRSRQRIEQSSLLLTPEVSRSSQTPARIESLAWSSEEE